MTRMEIGEEGRNKFLKGFMWYIEELKHQQAMEKFKKEVNNYFSGNLSLVLDKYKNIYRELLSNQYVVITGMKLGKVTQAEILKW